MAAKDRIRKAPIRTCVGCRASSPKQNLIRVVRTADGTVCLDPTGKMAGRGAYLCRTKECLALALKRNRLGRALRCEAPASVADEIESYLAARDVSEERDNDGDVDYGS